jgi:hypothetical protein
MSKNLKDKEKIRKINPFTVAIVILLVIVAGFIGWLIWYENAEPSCRIGNYKGLEISLSDYEIATSGVASAGIEIATDDDERVKQAILSRLVEDAKFYHLTKTVEERESQYMTYYNQLAALYDEYSSIEELATNYYGYESYEAFCNDVKSYAEVSIKQELVLNKIAQKEGFTVTDEIFNSYIGKYLEAYDYSEDEIDTFLENYGKEDVYSVILNDYTLDMIQSWSTITD